MMTTRYLLSCWQCMPLDICLLSQYLFNACRKVEISHFIQQMARWLSQSISRALPAQVKHALCKSLCIDDRYNLKLEWCAPHMLHTWAYRCLIHSKRPCIGNKKRVGLLNRPSIACVVAWKNGKEVPSGRWRKTPHKMQNAETRCCSTKDLPYAQSSGTEQVNAAMTSTCDTFETNTESYLKAFWLQPELRKIICQGYNARTQLDKPSSSVTSQYLCLHLFEKLSV